MVREELSVSTDGGDRGDTGQMAIRKARREADAREDRFLLLKPHLWPWSRPLQQTNPRLRPGESFPGQEEAAQALWPPVPLQEEQPEPGH